MITLFDIVKRWFYTHSETKSFKELGLKLEHIDSFVNWLWCLECSQIIVEINVDHIIVWDPDYTTPDPDQWRIQRRIETTDPQFFDIIHEHIELHGDNSYHLRMKGTRCTRP